MTSVRGRTKGRGREGIAAVVYRARGGEAGASRDTAAGSGRVVIEEVEGKGRYNWTKKRTVQREEEEGNDLWSHTNDQYLYMSP